MTGNPEETGSEWDWIPRGTSGIKWINMDTMDTMTGAKKILQYPLVISYIAIENGPVEIVSFSHEKWWIFP